MPDESNGMSRGRPENSDEQRRNVANEKRLRELGNAVDQHSGIPLNRWQRHAGPRRRRRVVAISAIVVVVLVAGVLGGGYLYARYRLSQIPRVKDPNLIYSVSGQPFNILTVGSDSRVGLSATAAQEVGAGSVSGQRSDVVKIIHVDPSNGTIAILSIPRDTVVTLLANQALYGKFNRINVNYGNGPSLLTQTIVANFGIPINHVIQVSFGGLLNAAESIGGVYLDFPNNAHDVMSGLVVNHPGCQLVNGIQALAVARSRHYLYSPTNRPWPKDGAALYHQGDLSTLAADGWLYDGTSDYGRIIRQNAFLRAMFARVKGSLGNPFKINSFLANLPKGVAIDSNFTLDEIIGLALKFHNYNTATMKTYTLPTYPGLLGSADVLFVQEPQSEQLLTQIFGSSLRRPTKPPPAPSGATPMPPVIPVTTTTVARTTTTSSSVSTSKHKSTTTTIHPVTTDTNPSLAAASFDPVPCVPR
jgi:LCP family protein required for cell wall assembly